MASSSTRGQTVVYTGDVQASLYNSAGTNANSPAQTSIQNLAIGFNAIVPPGGGTVPTALTIIPPVGNVNLMVLKGITGDTGIPLHKTDPTTVALDVSFTTLGITVTVGITGVRFIWS